MIMKQKKGGKTQADIDWDNRKLCSDGNCIGVIGADGCCKECGLPYGAKIDAEPADRVYSEDPVANDEPQAAEADANSGGIDDTGWENRILCSDGNCIGVIGRDGRCKECGLPLDSVH